MISNSESTQRNCPYFDEKRNLNAVDTKVGIHEWWSSIEFTTQIFMTEFLC